MSLALPQQVLRIINKKIPLHRNQKRVWMDQPEILETTIGENLRYFYTINKETKRLTIESNGIFDNRRVTLRKSGIPVIDINNETVTKLYEGVDHITIKIYNEKIIIEPLKEEQEQQKARAKLNDEEITSVELFCGAGTLTSALSGSTKCLMGIEIDQRYLNYYKKNNPSSLAYQTDIINMDTDMLPNATLLAAGIPCECYCNPGISKKNSLGCGIKEAGDTGSYGYFFLKSLEKIRPVSSIIEQSKNFAKSAMADMIKATLIARGYKITEKILKAPDYGAMTKRERYCMVATIADKPFEFPEVDIRNTRTVGEILEVAIKEREWHSKETHKTLKYLLEKEVIDAKKGNGFRMARTRVTDTTVATITKGYYKLQSTGAILVHPENEELYSWFTPRELARINGIKEDYILPETKTIAGEIIGQGVCVPVFEHVIRAVCQHIRDNRSVA